MREPLTHTQERYLLAEFILRVNQNFGARVRSCKMLVDRIKEEWDRAHIQLLIEGRPGLGGHISFELVLSRVKEMANAASASYMGPETFDPTVLPILPVTRTDIQQPRLNEGCLVSSAPSPVTILPSAATILPNTAMTTVSAVVGVPHRKRTNHGAASGHGPGRQKKTARVFKAAGDLTAADVNDLTQRELQQYARELGLVIHRSKEGGQENLLRYISGGNQIQPP